MKILHVANFSDSKFGAAFYSSDRKISNGLIRNGHCVYDFSYRDIARSVSLFRSTKFGRKKLVAAFLEAVQQVKPHLLLFGHSELFRADDLLAARKMNPSMKVAMWWVDDPFPPDRLALLRERMGILDALFTTVGVAPVSEVLGDRHSTLLSYFPNIIDGSIDTGRAFENKKPIHDVIFIGHATPERRQLLQALEKLSPLTRVKIYGGSRGGKVFGAQYLDLLASSKMGVNYSRYNNVSLYSSDRLAHLVGNGLLTFTPNVPELNTLFAEDEVVYFEDFKDFFVKVLFFNENWQAGQAHAKRGYLKAHAAFGEQRVTKFMLETIFKENYTEEYEWQNHVLV